MTTTTTHLHAVIERAMRQALPGYAHAALPQYTRVWDRVVAALPALVHDDEGATITAIRQSLGSLLDTAGVRDLDVAATVQYLPSLPAGAGDDWPLVEAIRDVMRGRGASHEEPVS